MFSVDKRKHTIQCTIILQPRVQVSYTIGILMERKLVTICGEGESTLSDICRKNAGQKTKRDSTSLLETYNSVNK